VALYRRVSVRVWGDQYFQGLSDGAKLLWLYLLTSPQTSPCGIFTFSPDRAARDLQLTAEPMRERFRELLIKAREKGDQAPLYWDRDHLVVWLPNFLIHNPPNNPNAIVSWVPYIEGLPEGCPLIPRWYQITERFLKQSRGSIVNRFRHLFQERFREQMAEPSPPITKARSRSGSGGDLGSEVDPGSGTSSQGRKGDPDLSPHPPAGAVTPPAQVKIKEGKLAGKVRYTGRGDLIRYDWEDHVLVPKANRARYVADMAGRYPEVDVEAIVRKVEAWLKSNVARGRKRQVLETWIERQWIISEAEKARARTGGKGRGRARVNPRTAQVKGKSSGSWEGTTE